MHIIIIGQLKSIVRIVLRFIQVSTLYQQDDFFIKDSKSYFQILQYNKSNFEKCLIVLVALFTRHSWVHALLVRIQETNVFKKVKSIHYPVISHVQVSFNRLYRYQTNL
jgi:hypothetical protein